MCKMNLEFSTKNLNDINKSTTIITTTAAAATTNPNEFLTKHVKNMQGCSNTSKIFYQSTIGILLAVPEWEAIITVIILSIIIILTIIGNVLVILSVFTYKPLRIVQNFFIVSLAVADLTVAILVLPFNVAYSILGRWEFGINLCKMWLTCDVLCCTSSILNLCAIALDRYWAITDPINYAQKRNVERVLILISGVWILSLIISSPPLIGWNDWPENFSNEYPCHLTSNQGYVIYSSLGSFYIPLFIMTIVYIEIYVATRRRLRERAWNSRIDTIALKNGCKFESSVVNIDQDQISISSETNHNENASCLVEKKPQQNLNNNNKTKLKRSKRKMPKQKNLSMHLSEATQATGQATIDESISDIPETSSETAIQIGKNFNDNNKKLLTNKNQVKRAPAVYQFIEEKQKISLSKERRAARTLGIIMGVFVVCWLPFFLMYVILPFCSSCCPTDKLINFVTWLGYVNSGLNPVIYTIFNIDYRRAFKKLLGIKF